MGGATPESCSVLSRSALAFACVADGGMTVGTSGRGWVAAASSGGISVSARTSVDAGDGDGGSVTGPVTDGSETGSSRVSWMFMLVRLHASAENPWRLSLVALAASALAPRVGRSCHEQQG